MRTPSPSELSATQQLVYAALEARGSATTRLREQGDGTLRYVLQDPGPLHPLARRGGPLALLSDDEIIQALVGLAAAKLVLTSTEVMHHDSTEYVIEWRRVTPPPALTGRQLHYLEALAKGLTNQQIADELVVTVKTVESALRTLFLRLDVENRTQAVRVALECGLLRLPLA